MTGRSTVARIIDSKFKTIINNALVGFGGCEYVLLAGLSAEQKSYLDELLKRRIHDKRKLN